ncbi:hypothetical protein BASA83_006324 [Batrachochytrium salamandrivorans]|nr:hypothetical protein BASA83_006324 [Batrachochytrium salamandrivorans]
MEENSEFIARNLEEVGQARSAANVRTKAQSEAMRNVVASMKTTPDYFFKVGDMVKMKHHERLKLEFRWKGPYHVVDVGHPGTYWIMTPQGLRLPNAVNQNDLAPWLAPVVDNVDFFYDGTSRTGTGLSTPGPRYDTDRKKIATLGTLLTDKALAWYNPYIEQPEHYAYDLSSWSAFKERMKATFGEINQEAGLRKSKLPCAKASHFVPRTNTSQYSSRTTTRPVRQDTTSAFSFFPLHLLPLQHRSTDDMDVDFARRGPLTPVERTTTDESKALSCLRQSGHLKATCPKSNSRFGSQRHVQAIENG